MNNLCEANVRIDKIIWLKAMTCFDSVSDDMIDFIENLPEETTDSLYETLPCLKLFAEAEQRLDPNEVCETLLQNEQEGFLFEASTPVYNWTDRDSAICSWGWTHYQWLYAPTIAEMEELAVKWAEQEHQADKRKAS